MIVLFGSHVNSTYGAPRRDGDTLDPTDYDPIVERSPKDTLKVMDRAETGIGRPRKVLVVEDDEMVREFAQSMLELLGYDPATAGDGEAALRILDEDDGIDLLLTDLGLPGELDGRALAAEAQRRRPGLRVLFASGSVDSEGKAAELAPGSIVLAKPYRKADLARRLDELFSAA